MSNSKTPNFDIQEYSFGQLVPTEDSPHLEGIQDYELKSLDEIADFKQSISADVIRTEREMESKNGFQIAPEVREQRGLKQQEEEDYERRIEEEVQRRLSAIQEQAYEEGLKQGYEKGHADAYAESTAKYDEIVTQFAEQIDALNSQMQDIYEQSKEEAYLMVKNLTKWIILKEVDEKYYLVRLLKKLIHEINTKSNLLVRVNEQSFGYMPEVIKLVERELGKLTNVRVEVDLDQENNGIILESENTIVDGSLETQFKSIDRIFENAGINE